MTGLHDPEPGDGKQEGEGRLPASFLAVDHRLEAGHAAKAALAQAATGRISGQCSTILKQDEPGRRGLNEMCMESRMICSSVLLVAVSTSSSS